MVRRTHPTILATLAVNNVGEFGRWAVCEVIDPFDGMRTIREFLT